MSVVFNNTNAMAHNGASSISTPLSVTAGGSNLCAFAVVLFDNTAGESITSVTYGGIAMTSCGAAVNNPTGNEYAQIFSLTTTGGLLTGSNTLIVTGSAGVVEVYVNLVSFTGVNQTTPVRAGTYITNTGSSITSLALTMSSSTSDLTIVAINTGSGGASQTSNQTVDGTSNLGSYSAGSSHATVSASSITDTWTSAGSTNMAMCGFSINGGNPVLAPLVSVGCIGF